MLRKDFPSVADADPVIGDRIRILTIATQLVAFITFITKELVLDGMNFERKN
jgi:hypothetical protein